MKKYKIYSPKKQKLESPDYKRIFNDIIQMRYPDKKKECKFLLSKKVLSALDILKLNKKIFGIEDKETMTFNQCHRSYVEEDIIGILEYQKKNKLNNSELAKDLHISRTTIAKRKKIFN